MNDFKNDRSVAAVFIGKARGRGGEKNYEFEINNEKRKIDSGNYGEKETVRIFHRERAGKEKQNPPSKLSDKRAHSKFATGKST